VTVGPDDQLINAAAFLRRVASREWEAFMTALARHADRIKDDCIKCAPEVVLTAQGRAKHATELVTLLGNCDELARKLETRANK